MNKGQKFLAGLLGVIALEGAVTAYGIIRIARGFEVEITMDQAEVIAKSVQEAKAAALEDIKEEEGEL